MRSLLIAVVWIGVMVSVARSQSVEPLWRDGAPGFEDRRDEPEVAEDWWVNNIHNPSLTVFEPPAERRTGAAAIVVPGGGHRLLVFGAEGVDMAHHLNTLGITAFVLKHRLPRQEGSPYDIDVHPRQDGLRAMRWVRHHADDYGIDTDKIGIVGFSAGGEVVSWVMHGENGSQPDAKDPIDRVSAQPNFQVLIYPGPLGIPDRVKTKLPPAFLIVAGDDNAAENIMRIAQQYREAEAEVELHLYWRGGHGFNMGQRSKLRSIATWSDRLSDWLIEHQWGQPVEL